MNIFKPNEIHDKYSDLDIDSLKKKGFKTILLDVDNTITPYFVPIPDKEGKAFVNKLKEAGFRVIVLSNNTTKRVKIVAESIDCEFYAWAMKPLPFVYFSLLHRGVIKKAETFCMGDQLVTDVLGGNLFGIYSIYIKPISTVDSFTTKINRKLERMIFKYILHEKV